MFEIVFRGPAKKFLKKIKTNEQKLIISKIKKLKDNPYLGERLSGNLHGFYKLRYDKYRILYKIREQELIIYVMNIGHRKNVYG